MEALATALDEVTEDSIKAAIVIGDAPLDIFLIAAGAELARDLQLPIHATSHLVTAINKLGLVLFTLGCLRTLDLYATPLGDNVS